MLRDTSIVGYTLNRDVNTHEDVEYVRHGGNCCIAAFDIERELDGPNHCMLRSKILCASVVCSCGDGLLLVTGSVDPNRDAVRKYKCDNVDTNAKLAYEFFFLTHDRTAIRRSAPAKPYVDRTSH